MTNPRWTPSKRNAARSTGRRTLADVAGLAGVTTMTVSRYLREPDRVAQATADKIRDALQTTGYTPNKQAGGLASGKSPVVAALIPNIGNTLFAESVQGLCDAFQPAGYELLLSATNYSIEREEELLRAILGWMPAALVITGRRHSPATLQMMREAQRAGAPVVEIWDVSAKASEFPQIGFDHELVGGLMADHLADCGYRDLVYVDSGVLEDFRAHERGVGFMRQARRRGCRVAQQVAPQGEQMLAGRQALQALVDRGLPRAVACANDHLAVGAYLEAQARGIAVPQTLGILGFGDFPITAHLGGGISTVTTDRYNLGRAAALHVLHGLGRTELVPEALGRQTGAPAPGTPAPASVLDQAQALPLQPRIVRRTTS